MARVRFEDQPDWTARVKMQGAEGTGRHVDDEARACMYMGDDKIASRFE